MPTLFSSPLFNVPRIALAALLACSLIGTATGKETFAPGPKIGTTAPEFALRDQHDEEQKLSQLIKNGPVAVVFHRSAQW